MELFNRHYAQVAPKMNNNTLYILSLEFVSKQRIFQVYECMAWDV